MTLGNRHVRFTPKSGHWWRARECPLCAKNGHHAPQQNQSLSITSGEYAPLRQLFVVRDATALSADARLKGLLDGGLTCLWEIKVHRNDISFRRTLDCIERSLAYRIVANLKGADISS
jgi:hypothetical protein